MSHEEAGPERVRSDDRVEGKNRTERSIVDGDSGVNRKEGARVCTCVYVTCVYVYVYVCELFTSPTPLPSCVRVYVYVYVSVLFTSPTPLHSCTTRMSVCTCMSVRVGKREGGGGGGGRGEVGGGEEGE